MPRVIQTITKPIFGFNIKNFYTDGTVENNYFYENDTITGLNYIENNKVNSISGRIDKVGTKVKGITTTKYNTKNSYLETDISIPIVVIDSSKNYQSSVVTIQTKDILAFNPSKEVDHISIRPVLKVYEKIVYADKSESEIIFEEKKDIYGLSFMDDGKLKTGDYTVAAFIYAEKRSSVNNLIINGIKLVNNKEIIYVPFKDIISCGTEGTTLKEGESLTDAISNITYGGVTIPSVVVSDKINITSNITLKGAKANIAANEGNRCTTNDIPNETVFTNTIDAIAGADVTLNGVTLTTDSLMNIGSANSFTIENCRIFGITTEGKRNYLIKDSFNENNEDGVLLQIENCYFGDNTLQDEDGKINVYNLFEITSKLANGSYIKNNYFAKPACSHNIINLYDVKDGATIEISGNHFEYSGNAIRVGFINEPKCTVIIKNNIVDETDISNNGIYAGLALIQPYGKRTKSFKNVTIKFENNKYPKNEQLYYFYAGSNDTPMTNKTKPRIYVNGSLQVN